MAVTENVESVSAWVLARNGTTASGAVRTRRIPLANLSLTGWNGPKAVAIMSAIDTILPSDGKTYERRKSETVTLLSE